jgi:hypothetical protein
MTNFINYAQILTDFRNLINTANPTLLNGGVAFEKVFKNAQEIDYGYENMPLLDCRFKEANPLNTAGNTYYSDIWIEVEIACYDMTSRDNCATMRENLTNAVQRLVQTNPHFSANVDTVQVGRVVFETGEGKAQGEWIASALLDFHVKLYTET